MWKKLVAALTIIMILSFVISTGIDGLLTAGEDDSIEWHSDDGIELAS